jgi:UDP-glucose 4-epimerase
VTAACWKGVQQFIYLSTAHVYANPLVGVITEENCPRNLHPYATSHLAGEQEVLRANQNRKIRGYILRLSNIFGTPMHVNANCWMLLVNDLCRQAVKDRCLTLRTDGGQHRDFIPMNTVVRMLDGLVDNKINVEEGILNIGSGTSKTLLEMTEFIQASCEKALGFKPELQVTQTADHRPIYYRSERLAISNLYSKEDENVELYQLLHYCNKEFRFTEK